MANSIGALDTSPLREIPCSLQSQGDPSTRANRRIPRRRWPMSFLIHRVSTPNKHCVNRLYVHQKYGVETKEPTTSAVLLTNSSINTSGWIAMATKKAWGIVMKRACVSRRSHQGAEGKVLPLVNASKREVCFHVESQRLSECMLQYHLIPCWEQAS
jgi:hypothetical protein